MAVAAAAVVFTSCKPNETNEGLLTIKKGWKLESALSTPAYTNSAGITSPNLFESWFADCEKKDVIYFKSGGATEVKFGCEGNTKQTTGTWRFVQEDPSIVLNMRIHFFEEDGDAPIYSNVDVLELTKDVFKYNYVWQNTAGTVYTFTLTYKPA